MPPKTHIHEIPPTSAEQEMRAQAERVLSGEMEGYLDGYATALAGDVLTLLDEVADLRNALNDANERYHFLKQSIRTALNDQ